MLYGYNTSPRTTIVTAAHNEQEFRAWYASLNHDGALYTSARETDLFENLTNDDWNDLKTTVYVFTFEHDYNQAEFARIHDIVILPRMPAVDKNADMEYLSRELNFENETRTIGEIAGLDKHDPWDKRSDEEKAEDKIMSERMKELQKADKISSDSFSPNTKASVSVTDIHTSANADGTINIDQVNAVKRTGNEAEEAMAAMARVRDSEHRTERPAVLEQAEIVDVAALQAKLEAKANKPKRTKKAKE